MIEEIVDDVLATEVVEFRPPSRIHLNQLDYVVHLYLFGILTRFIPLSCSRLPLQYFDID